MYKSVYNSFMLQVRKEKQRDKFFESLKYEAMIDRLDEDDSELIGKIEKIKKIVNLLPDRCREFYCLVKEKGIRIGK